MDIIQRDSLAAMLRSPQDVLRDLSGRVRALRLEQNITQQMLSDRVGIAVGTVKRFEKTGEIQFHHLLRIALVLGCLEEFDTLFVRSEKPDSLYHFKEPVIRKRARQK